MANITFNALLSRGIDSESAQRFINDGYNLTKLKKLPKKELVKLGLGNSVIESILKDNRPPIPLPTIISLLYKSKSTCCVCRDNTKSVIIHHIEEWSKSRDHSENNLVVLCLQHHDEAHSKKSLSINLSAQHLIAFKKQWIASVESQDAYAILGLKRDISRWDYVNIQRVFELILDFDIYFQDNRYLQELIELNIIDRRGIPKSNQVWKIPDKPEWHICDFAQGVYFAHYLKAAIEAVLKKLPLVDVTNNLNVSFVKSVVKPGSIITGQFGYYFSDIDKFERSKKQLRRGYYQVNDIRIEFIFNAWECTSSSGRFDALTGHRVAIPIIIVRSIIEDKDKNIIINGSCLAIGTWFENHRILDDKFHTILNAFK